jgi:DNA cross-link repair 1C protein
MSSGNAVFITPIVTRAGDGLEVPELGAGGGKGDLHQSHELELPDEDAVEQLEKLCLEQIKDDKVLFQTKEALLSAFKSKNKTLSLDEYGLKDDSDISLSELVMIISHGQKKRTEDDGYSGSHAFTGLWDKAGRDPPRTIVSGIVFFSYFLHFSIYKWLIMI